MSEDPLSADQIAITGQSLGLGLICDGEPARFAGHKGQPTPPADAAFQDSEEATGAKQKKKNQTM